MTVAVATPRVQYTGNGVTTAFAFSQKIFSLDDLIVYREVISTGVTSVVSSSEYTVSGSAASTGGYSDATVTFSVAPTADHKITLVRATPKSQTTDYVTNAGFPADGHENAMDKLVMVLQEVVYDISRTIKQNVSANGDLTFPTLIAGFLYSNGTTLEFKSLGDITTVPTYGGSFLYGADAGKAAAPTAGDLYLATDTKKFYRCYVNGTWSVDATFAVITQDAGVFPVQGAAPTTAASQLGWYTKTVSGQPEWFYRKAANGTEIQITSNSKLILPLDASIATFPKGYLQGLVLSNDAGDLTNDLGVSVGVARDDTDTYNIKLTAAIVKRGDAAFVAGTAQGGGNITGGAGLKYIYLIGKAADATAADVFFSASAPGAVALPATWDIKRLVGARYWDGSKWALFMTIGTGVVKQTFLHVGIALVAAGVDTSFTDVDVSAYAADGYAKKIGIIAKDNAASCGSLYLRINGAAEAAGAINTYLHDANSVNNNLGGHTEIVLDSAGVFEYAVDAGAVNIWLRDFTEAL